MTETLKTNNDFASGMREFADARYDKSVELFTRAIENGSESALTLVSRGAAFFKQDRLDRAWDDFDRGVKLDPGYARAYHMRGLVSERRGDDLAALADFDRAIELNPEYGAAYYSRATLHTKLSNTDKAQDDIRTMTILGNRNLESFMADNNLWHSQQMRVEDLLETELDR